MNRYTKTLLLISAAGILMFGVPYVKAPGSCGLPIPLSFTGGLLGCGGENSAARAENSGENAVQSVSEGKTQADDANRKVKVTFVELGSLNCVPCKMMQPVMKRVEKKYAGQVKIVFHDVWTDQGKAEGYRYKVRVIPTQVFLDKEGKEFFRHEGFLPFEEVDKILTQKGVR